MRYPICISLILMLFLVAACDEVGKKAIFVLKNIEQSDSNMAVVNSVQLKYKSSVTLKVNFYAGEIKIDESIADVSLKGNENKAVELQVSYFEYKPQDAIIYTENSTLKCKSKSGKPVLISKIKGTIPNNLKLYVETGSGNIGLSMMQGNALVNVSTGSGDVSVQQSSKWQEAIVKTGSGDVSMEVDQADRLLVEAGSGDISLTNSRVVSLTTTTGSGNITMINSQAKDMKASTGSGDIHLKSSVITKRDFSQGSGDTYED